MALETYVGNNGKTTVRDDFPERRWIPIGDNQRLSNIVLESAKLKRDTKHGEAIFVFCHDADTGELYATTFGMAIGTRNGKPARGTVFSDSAVSTLLDCEFEGDDRRDIPPIANPQIKPAFINRKMWIGKTVIAGKTWKAFECDFVEGELKFDSSFRGMSEEDDEGVTESPTEDKPEVDMTDAANVFIAEMIGEGKDALTMARTLEEKFPVFTSYAAVKRVMQVKKSLE